MAWTKHGHYVEGTVLDYSDRPDQTARCGGPGLCDECSKEASQLKREYDAKQAEAKAALEKLEAIEAEANKAAVEANK